MVKNINRNITAKYQKDIFLAFGYLNSNPLNMNHKNPERVAITTKIENNFISQGV